MTSPKEEDLKSPEERQQWIREWLCDRPGKSVDVLNSDFVFAYIEATKAKWKPTMFGALKCPQLGRDLGSLYKANKLRRFAIGLPAGDASMGFPKWVYSYRL